MLRFGILGPLAVDRDGQPLAIPTGLSRQLLGALIVNSDSALSVNVLLDMLWGEQPPRTAATALHGHVSRLRKVLGDDAVRTTSVGYRLAAGADAIDGSRFRTMVDQARYEHDDGARSRRLRDALSLWRGPALADFCYEPFAQGAISVLEEMRVTAIEDTIEADLAGGRHTALVGELRTLVRQHPLRERLWEHLMLALYRSGRQAEALDTYHAARRRLADDLGVEPGPALRELESAILRHDAALRAPSSQDHVKPAPSLAPVQLRADGVDAKFVGRQRELGQLQAMLNNVTTSRRPALATVIGEPGLGKSRLVAEFAARVWDRVTVLKGHCQPHVESTYAPLIELLAQVRIGPGEPGAGELSRLRDALDGGQAVAARIIDAAAVRFFASAAERRPLLIVLEDVHWAQPALLDLVEALGAHPEGAVMMVCLARPELAELRSSFGTDTAGAVTVELSPLPATQVRQLILDVVESDAPDDAVSEIVSVAHGNPLFALQLVAWAEDADGSARSVPPAVRTLLANRIGRLAPGEFAVVRCAAIAGDVVPVDAVTALLPEEVKPTAARHLASLARRQLVQPTSHGYRFRHDLIRQTSYLAMDPGIRADLHEQYADWLSTNGSASSGSTDETIGYHLESARDNLLVHGRDDERARGLATRASVHFAAAGYLALGRRDMPGAASLLTRSARLLPSDDPRRRSLLIDACPPLRRSGRTQETATTAMDVIELAQAAGDIAIEWRARLELAFVRGYLRGDLFSSEEVRVTEEAIAVLTPLQDHQGLAAAWVMIGMYRDERGQLTAAATAYRHARDHARLDPTNANGGQIAWGLAFVLLEGPTPIPDAIQRCRELVDWRGTTIPGVLLELANLHALNGDFEESRALLVRAACIFREWGLRRGPIYVAHTEARVELAAGALDAAEKQAWLGLELGASVGGDENDGANALVLAEALVRQGRLAEVEDVVRAYASAPSIEDIGRTARWNAIRAATRMNRGEWADAVEFAGRAVAAVDECDLFTLRADLRLTLAEALHGSGDFAVSQRVVGEAVGLYQAKGNVVGLGRTRDRWPGHPSWDASHRRMGDRR